MPSPVLGPGATDRFKSVPCLWRAQSLAQLLRKFLQTLEDNPGIIVLRKEESQVL